MALPSINAQLGDCLALDDEIAMKISLNEQGDSAEVCVGEDCATATMCIDVPLLRASSAQANPCSGTRLPFAIVENEVLMGGGGEFTRSPQDSSLTGLLIYPVMGGCANTIENGDAQYASLGDCIVGEDFAVLFHSVNEETSEAFFCLLGSQGNVADDCNSVVDAARENVVSQFSGLAVCHTAPIIESAESDRCRGNEFVAMRGSNPRTRAIGIIVGICVGIVACCALCIAGCCFLKRRQKRQQGEGSGTELGGI